MEPLIKHYYHTFHEDGFYYDSRFTIAVRFNDDFSLINIAASLCNEKDQFVKKIGRQLAIDRLTIPTESGDFKNIIVGVTPETIAKNGEHFKGLSILLYENRSRFYKEVAKRIISGILIECKTRRDFIETFNL